MITILGVGHVFDISSQVRRAILESGAQAVCLELDPKRYQALQEERKGRQGSLIYRMLAIFQRRIASQYGGEVGQEMISAVDAAREMGADALFIDVDATDLFSRLWREMPAGEKMKLLTSSFFGIFMTRERVEKELDRFQENEEEYMRYFQGHLPTMKRVLIDDRNRTMAQRLERAEEHYGNVVAVVGDGHVEGMRQFLEGRELRVTRLRELRRMEADSDFKPKGGNAEVHFRFSHE
ncbi:MAG: TraB/GumN family protein [Methanomassiliicoccales archaeon]